MACTEIHDHAVHQARPQEHTKVQQTYPQSTRPARAERAAEELRASEKNLYDWGVAYTRVQEAYSDAIGRNKRALEEVYKIAKETT